METILKTSYPLGGIQSIEIFAPERSNEGALKFPTKINGEAFIFYLNDDAIWEAEGETILPDDIRHFISDQIESKHL